MTVCIWAGGNISYTKNFNTEVNIKTTKVYKYYLGMGLSTVATNFKSFSNPFLKKREQDRNGAILLVGGYNINNFLSIEGRYIKSFVKENFLNQTIFGLYLKPKYQYNQKVELYGLIGVGKVKLTPYNGSNIHFKHTNIHLGFGGEYKLSSKVKLFIDYVNYDINRKRANYYGNMKKVNTSSLNMGLLYSF